MWNGLLMFLRIEFASTGGPPSFAFSSRILITDSPKEIASPFFTYVNTSYILLRDPLVKALHDGGYVQRAEEILGDLLHQSGRDEVVWLAKVIHDHWEDLSGGHSGEFRLLLKNISKAPDGPSLLAWAIIGLG